MESSSSSSPAPSSSSNNNPSQQQPQNPPSQQQPPQQLHMAPHQIQQIQQPPPPTSMQQQVQMQTAQSAVLSTPTSSQQQQHQRQQQHQQQMSTIKTEAITSSQSIQLQVQPNSQASPVTSTPTCSIATTPTVVSQLSQGPRGIPGTQIRPQGEYLVLLAPNPRQPGLHGIRYPIQAMNLGNQPNILQSPVIRSINASQLIRPQTSNSGVMQTPSSQAQTTTMASIAGRHIQLPFGATGPRGQITLPNGQTLMPSAIPIQRHPMMTPRATILQQPTLIRGVSQSTMGIHSVIPPGQNMAMGVPASALNPNAQIIHQQPIMATSQQNVPAAAPSQMTPEDALAKGKNFFLTLLTKTAVGAAKKKTMTNLIQSYIDCKKTSEEFATSLQKEMNSDKQQQLVPFLDLLLPHIRQALDVGTMKLPGIRGPNQREPPSPIIQTTSLSQTITQSSTPPSQPNTPTASTSSTNNAVQSAPNNSTAKKPKKEPLPPGQKSKYQIRKEAQAMRKKEKERLASEASVKIETPEEDKTAEKTDKPVKAKPDKPRPKPKKQEKQLDSISSALRDDDDVNDVAAMGGVNLAEESQRIMASGAELVGTQIRSCKDVTFLDMKVLTAKIAKITKEHDLSEPSTEVVTLVSHAMQERLKNLVERLGVLADHRSENLKTNGNYEISTDIKAQMKFLADLDRIEKRRCEEQERELMLRVAKSRSKVEDPEQQKLRQKAKDMQRAEQEEARQREANETALLAIGPRKKMKSSTLSTTSSFSQSSSIKDLKSSIDMRSVDSIRRIKRVNMRDLQALLELDRTHIDRLMKLTVL